jgi:hypothetical protein
MLTWNNNLCERTSKRASDPLDNGLSAPFNKITKHNFEDRFEENIYASVYCNETLLNGPYTNILHTYLFLK